MVVNVLAILHPAASMARAVVSAWAVRAPKAVAPAALAVTEEAVKARGTRTLESFIFAVGWSLGTELGLGSVDGGCNAEMMMAG